jgi:hypothetical protein
MYFHDNKPILENLALFCQALNRKTPEIKNTEHAENVISLATFRWKSHAQKLFQLPIAA